MSCLLRILIVLCKSKLAIFPQLTVTSHTSHNLRGRLALDSLSESDPLWGGLELHFLAMLAMDGAP